MVDPSSRSWQTSIRKIGRHAALAFLVNPLKSGQTPYERIIQYISIERACVALTSGLSVWLKFGGGASPKQSSSFENWRWLRTWSFASAVTFSFRSLGLGLELSWGFSPPINAQDCWSFFYQPLHHRLQNFFWSFTFTKCFPYFTENTISKVSGLIAKIIRLPSLFIWIHNCR